jgi:hypothetical protein
MKAAKDTRMIERRFITSPARILAAIVMRPVANTSAFGGVATGSMKAQLAAMVRAGLVMNLLSIVLVSLAALLLAPLLPGAE